MVPRGTVLFTSRAPIGYVAIASQPVCTNQGFKSFVPKDRVSSDYLYWYLRHATQKIRDMGSGTTFSEISTKVAKTIPVVLAPLDDQRRIVEVIEEQLSRLDAGVESLQRAKRNLTRLRASLLNDVYSRPNISWTTLGAVSRIGAKLVDPRMFLHWPHVAPNHVESHTGRLLPHSTVGLDGVTSSKYLFRPGDIIYSKIRPYLAKSVVAEFEGLCSADMYPITTTLAPRFLNYWLLSPRFTAMAAKHQGRSVLPKINRNALFRLPAPTCDREAQLAVVSEVERQFSIIDAMAKTIEAGLQRAGALRQSILSQAFSGQLVRPL